MGLAAACSSSSSGGGGSTDAGPDVTSSNPADASSEAGTEPLDGANAVDAGGDHNDQSAGDSGFDASVDAGSDGGAGRESGVAEGGPSEASTDAADGGKDGAPANLDGGFCTSIAPPSVTIIGGDPSDAGDAGPSITYGTGNNIWTAYAYGGPSEPAPAIGGSENTLAITGSIVSLGGGSLEFAGAGVNYSSYGGARCLDASSYTGIQFTVGGSLGGCALGFFVEISEDATATYDPLRGECTIPDQTANCYPPHYALSGTGTFSVAFSDFVSGNPSTIDPTQITNIYWQLTPAEGILSPDDASAAAQTCSASITISNVSFYP